MDTRSRTSWSKLTVEFLSLSILLALSLPLSAARIKNTGWKCPNGLPFEQCGHTACGEKWICTDDIDGNIPDGGDAGSGLESLFDYSDHQDSVESGTGDPKAGSSEDDRHNPLDKRSGNNSEKTTTHDEYKVVGWRYEDENSSLLYPEYEADLNYGIDASHDAADLDFFGRSADSDSENSDAAKESRLEHLVSFYEQAKADEAVVAVAVVEVDGGAVLKVKRDNGYTVLTNGMAGSDHMVTNYTYESTPIRRGEIDEVVGTLLEKDYVYDPRSARFVTNYENPSGMSFTVDQELLSDDVIAKNIVKSLKVAETGLQESTDALQETGIHEDTYLKVFDAMINEEIVETFLTESAIAAASFGLGAMGTDLASPTLRALGNITGGADQINTGGNFASGLSDCLKYGFVPNFGTRILENFGGADGIESYLLYTLEGRNIIAEYGGPKGSDGRPPSAVERPENPRAEAVRKAVESMLDPDDLNTMKKMEQESRPRIYSKEEMGRARTVAVNLSLRIEKYVRQSDRSDIYGWIYGNLSKMQKTPVSTR